MQHNCAGVQGTRRTCTPAMISASTARPVHATTSVEGAMPSLFSRLRGGAGADVHCKWGTWRSGSKRCRAQSCRSLYFEPCTPPNPVANLPAPPGHPGVGHGQHHKAVHLEHLQHSAAVGNVLLVPAGDKGKGLTGYFGRWRVQKDSGASEIQAGPAAWVVQVRPACQPLLLPTRQQCALTTASAAPAAQCRWRRCTWTPRWRPAAQGCEQQLPQPRSRRARRNRAARSSSRAALHMIRVPELCAGNALMQPCLPQSCPLVYRQPQAVSTGRMGCTLAAHLRLARHRGLAEVGVHDAHGDEVEEEVAPVQVCRRGGVRKRS